MLTKAWPLTVEEGARAEQYAIQCETVSVRYKSIYCGYGSCEFRPETPQKAYMMDLMKNSVDTVLHCLTRASFSIRRKTSALVAEFLPSCSSVRQGVLIQPCKRANVSLQSNRIVVSHLQIIACPFNL